MKYTLILIALISCAHEPFCELDQWGYLNVKNRTNRFINIEVNKTGHLIEANDSITIFDVPAGRCELIGYDGFDTIRHVTEIEPCLVSSVEIRYID